MQARASRVTLSPFELGISCVRSYYHAEVGAGEWRRRRLVDYWHDEPRGLRRESCRDEMRRSAQIRARLLGAALPAPDVLPSYLPRAFAETVRLERQQWIGKHAKPRSVLRKPGGRGGRELVVVKRRFRSRLQRRIVTARDDSSGLPRALWQGTDSALPRGPESNEQRPGYRRSPIP